MYQALFPPPPHKSLGTKLHWNKPNLMQAASSLNQSHHVHYMRTFPLKVHYKAIKILAVRWVGMRHTFTEKLLHIFSHRAKRGAAWPLHFKFASYAYAGDFSSHFHPYISMFPVSHSLVCSNIFLHNGAIQ